MGSAGNTPSIRKPELDDSIDAFLSEADPPVAPAQGVDEPARSLSFRAPVSRLRGLIPGSRELWARALLVSAGLAMIVTAALLVLAPPDETPQTREVVSAPILSIIPVPSAAPADSRATHPPGAVTSPVPETLVANRPSGETAAASRLAEPALNAVPQAASPAGAVAAETSIGARDTRMPDPISLEENAPDVSLPAPPLQPRDQRTPSTELVPVAAVVTNPTPPDLRIADRLSGDKAAITNVLGAYQQSYSALDVESVSTIWQGLDVRGLRRAFSTLSSQDLSFDRCDVQVVSDSAKATCTGVLSYVRKIGDDGPRERRLSWEIDLRRHGDRWLIANVMAK